MANTSKTDETNPEISKDQYNTIASLYDGLEALPHSKISQQLVLYALLNSPPFPFPPSTQTPHPNPSSALKGKTILDLGGGTGLHARAALAYGAERVDNVDISPEMLRLCEEKERAAGRVPGEKIRCFVGDAGERDPPLLQRLRSDEPDFDLGEGGYDVVMMNWTFDHAATIPELLSMWQNSSDLTKPGGKIISIRSTDPRVPRAGDGKYGVKLSDIKPFDGGCSYTYTPQLGPQHSFSAQASLMEACWDLELAREMARRVGFEGLEVVPAGEMEVVKEDTEGFWREFVEMPGFVCVVGTKKKD